MKKKISGLLIIGLITISAIQAQDIDKMNKSELRSYIGTLSAEIETQKGFVALLEDSGKKLYEEKTSLESTKAANEQEIGRLNEKLEEQALKMNQMEADHASTIAELDETIASLNSSISSLNARLGASSAGDPDDFLNGYFTNQEALNNNSFELVLSQVFYGYVNKNNEDYYYDDYSRVMVTRLPELIDANALTYWEPKSGVKMVKDTEIKDYLVAKSSEAIDIKMPKIEILKNKLFTLIYEDGSEESFLFNVDATEEDNNQRQILRITLANEEVKDSDYNATAKDIVWRAYALGGECYVALSYKQLERLKLNIFKEQKGLETAYNGRLEFIETDEVGNYYTSGRYTTTGKGIYITRKKDAFMVEEKFLNPEELVYLFKWK